MVFLLLVELIFLPFFLLVCELDGGDGLTDAVVLEHVPLNGVPNVDVASSSKAIV